MPEHVPTADELVVMGLAVRDASVAKGGLSRIRITDQGHALLGTTLRANGREAAQANERHKHERDNRAT